MSPGVSKSGERDPEHSSSLSPCPAGPQEPLDRETPRGWPYTPQPRSGQGAGEGTDGTTWLCGANLSPAKLPRLCRDG